VAGLNRLPVSTGISAPRVIEAVQTSPPYDKNYFVPRRGSGSLASLDDLWLGLSRLAWGDGYPPYVEASATACSAP